MRGRLISLTAAAIVGMAAIPAPAQVQMQRQDATVATGVAPAPPTRETVGAAPAMNSAPFAAATIRTFTYQPVCEVRREQFADEFGWRVRDVRICY
jgi:hypothetical protein